MALPGAVSPKTSVRWSRPKREPSSKNRPGTMPLAPSSWGRSSIETTACIAHLQDSANIARSRGRTRHSTAATSRLVTIGYVLVARRHVHPADEVGSAVGIDARREPAAMSPGGEIRGDERRDPRLVGGQVGGGDALAPLAGCAAAEEGARVLPEPERGARPVNGAALAHPGQARLCRQLTRAVG